MSHVVQVPLQHCLEFHSLSGGWQKSTFLNVEPLGTHQAGSRTCLTQPDIPQGHTAQAIGTRLFPGPEHMAENGGKERYRKARGLGEMTQKSGGFVVVVPGSSIRLGPEKLRRAWQQSVDTTSQFLETNLKNSSWHLTPHGSGPASGLPVPVAV